MASEDTLIGNDFTVMLGDSSSPPIYRDLCTVFDFGAIGEEKPLIDVTSLCDDGRTYRNGLADGVEIPLQCNFIVGDALLLELYNHYKNDTIAHFRIVATGTTASPDNYFEFDATVRAWNITGTVGERAVLTFTLKVSGAVTWVQ